MQAFAAAMAAGADGVELDVRLCATGELVVFHDDSLLRLCGDHRLVENVTWDELKTLRVDGEGIPLLREVLEEVPTALVNIELKKHPLQLAPALVAGCRRDIEASAALSRVVVSSFDPRLLLMLRAVEPNVPRGLLFAKEQGLPFRRGWLAKGLAPIAVHPEHVLVSRARMRAWHRRGLRVHAWTVDDPERITELAELGVDAIICNDPGAARARME